MAPAADGVHAGWQTLTPGERRIVNLVVEGATNAEIARQLLISPKTVEAHLGHVYRKLGVRSRAHLAYCIGWEAALARHAA